MFFHDFLWLRAGETSSTPYFFGADELVNCPNPWAPHLQSTLGWGNHLPSQENASVPFIPSSNWKCWNHQLHCVYPSVSYFYGKFCLNPSSGSGVPLKHSRPLFGHFSFKSLVWCHLECIEAMTPRLWRRTRPCKHTQDDRRNQLEAWIILRSVKSLKVDRIAVSPANLKAWKFTAKWEPLRHPADGLDSET